MQDKVSSQRPIPYLTKEENGKVCCAYLGTSKCLTYKKTPMCFNCEVMKSMIEKLRVVETLEDEILEEKT